MERKTYIHPLTEIKETYYSNQKWGQDYREYRRIIGGIAWPYGIKPGFSVVIGEDRYEDITRKKRHYHLLAEDENTDSMGLLKKCLELQGQYLVNSWYGNTQNEPMMEFAFEINKKRDKGIKGLYISDAPHIGDPHAFEFYVDITKQRMMGKYKSLHLMEESRLPSYLMELKSHQLSKVKAETFPAIASFGYAVSALQIYQALDETKNEMMDRFFLQRSIEGI